MHFQVKMDGNKGKGREIVAEGEEGRREMRGGHAKS